MVAITRAKQKAALTFTSFNSLTSMRPFGYHISGGQHLGDSLQATVKAGFTAAQIFLGPAQKMAITPLPASQIDLFQRVKEQSGIKVYVHAPYVLHAYAKPENVVKNNGFIRRMVQVTHELQCDGYVLHMGGTKWYDDVYAQNDPVGAEAWIGIGRTLMETVHPKGNPVTGCPILFENCANGNAMSGQLDVICRMLDELARDGHNVGLCLDTLHAWAWGYNYGSPSDFARVTHCDVLRHLKLLHLNSGTGKVACGSKYDRHEAIHKGCIDVEHFRSLLRAFPGVPVIAEREDFADILAEFSFIKSVDQEVVAQ
jgi:endonuclease IV